MSGQIYLRQADIQSSQDSGKSAFITSLNLIILATVYRKDTTHSKWLCAFCVRYRLDIYVGRLEWQIHEFDTKTLHRNLYYLILLWGRISLLWKVMTLTIISTIFFCWSWTPTVVIQRATELIWVKSSCQRHRGGWQIL